MKKPYYFSIICGKLLTKYLQTNKTINLWGKVDKDSMEKKIMLGNEAFARGAYEAGVKVVSS